MQRRGYVVEIQNHDIVVRVTGTSYTATYHRLGDSLLARNLPLRDDHRAPMSSAGVYQRFLATRQSQAAGLRVDGRVRRPKPTPGTNT